MGNRCLVCTSNDREALIEQVAGDLWESRRPGTLDDYPWAKAGGYWRRIYLELGETAVDSLTGTLPGHS